MSGSAGWLGSISPSDRGSLRAKSIFVPLRLGQPDDNDFVSTLRMGNLKARLCLFHQTGSGVSSKIVFWVS